MDFKEEDFPLYQHITRLDPAASIHSREAFAAACAGGDIEKYKFAFGLQTESKHSYRWNSRCHRRNEHKNIRVMSGNF